MDALVEPENEPVTLGILLACVQISVYFAFILTGAYAPQLMQLKVVGSVTLSFAFGLLVIANGVLLTAIYVLYANRKSLSQQSGRGLK